MSKDGIVVLTHKRGLLFYICSLGFPTTFNKDVALQFHAFCL